MAMELLFSIPLEECEQPYAGQAMDYGGVFGAVDGGFYYCRKDYGQGAGYLLREYRFTPSGLTETASYPIPDKIEMNVHRLKLGYCWAHLPDSPRGVVALGSAWGFDPVRREVARLALENPYDPAARKASGLPYHWDHAYYDGQYYMYFGIVPVLLLFLPYRVLTGTALTTYCATQVFTAVFIVGVFALFYLLVRKFFPKLPLSVYLALSVAISVMSIWYAAAEPALYCTAITAAMALEIWSLYFFVRGVWCVEKENKQLVFAGIGAALGALVFGCRPPIALANLLVLPMLWVFLKQRKFSRKLLGKMALAALPYVVVAVALMAYNYARFDNPFEFGQKYQLTVADQSQYSLRLDAETLQKLFKSTKDNFFFHEDRSETFPYLKTNSVFFNFPILLLGLGAIPGWRGLKKTGLLPLFLFTGITAVVITAVDVLWTPYLLERYRMDIYFLMGIGCFVAFGAWHHRCAPKGKRYLNFTAGALSVCTVVCSFLYYVKTVGVYYPEKVTEVAKLLGLGQ